MTTVDSDSGTEPTGPTMAQGLAKVLRRPRFWLAPIVTATAVLSLLAAAYMGGVANPQRELHDFPVAIVNSDVGDPVTAEDGTTSVQNVGNQIVEQVVAGIDSDRIDLRTLGIDEAEHHMDTGQIYGMIVISGDFTKTLRNFGAGGVVAGDLERPVITVYTNPRMGASSSQFVTTIANSIMEQVQPAISTQLVDTVDAALPAGQELTGASAIAFEEPVRVIHAERFPLPEGSGVGLSAFYFALLLVLAGYTGSMVIHTLVDGGLGVIPLEYGPLLFHDRIEPVRRLTTLLIKWTILAVYSVLMSGLFVVIAVAAGMNTPNAPLLWVYGMLAILAVGITALTILAIVGNAGLLVGLLLFIALGLPSAGATIPLEASPPFYTWLSEFIPMRQVYLAVRSILYFDAAFDSGLGRGLAMTLGATVVAALVGLAATAWFDRRGLVRSDEATAELLERAGARTGKLRRSEAGTSTDTDGNGSDESADGGSSGGAHRADP